MNKDIDLSEKTLKNALLSSLKEGSLNDESKFLFRAIAELKNKGDEINNEKLFNLGLNNMIENWKEVIENNNQPIFATLCDLYNIGIKSKNKK